MQMIFFSGFMMWSFNWQEYQVQRGEPQTSVWRPLWDSINLCTPLLYILSFIRYTLAFLTHVVVTYRGLCHRNRLGVFLFCKSYQRPPASTHAYQTVLRSGFWRGRLRTGGGRTKKQRISCVIRHAHEL